LFHPLAPANSRRMTHPVRSICSPGEFAIRPMHTIFIFIGVQSLMAPAAFSVNRTQMTQKKPIYADKTDKIRIICENLRASDVSAFHFHSLSACSRSWRLLPFP